MSDSALLLHLMRRIRRRRRWVGGLEGAARGIAVATGLLALATVGARLAGHGAPGTAREAALAIAAVAIVAAGGAAAAARRVPLPACARAMDRALGAGDDTTLSAVALCVPATTTTARTNRFVTELMAQAVARARAVPTRRVIPPPRRRPMGLAAAGICLWAAAAAVPARGRSAAARPPATARGTSSRPDEASRLRMTARALEAEREDARAARLAAAATGDRALARLAGAFDALLSDLTEGRLDAAVALARLGSLSRATADDARRATAAQAAAARLAVAARGDHAARATAAAAASAALAGAAREAGDARAPGARADTAREPPARAQGPASTDPAEESSADEQRQLESLRRDLDDQATAADCQGDPDRCRRQADDAAGTRAALERMGRTAEARDRLAQSARQLQDRVQRGGASPARASSSSASPTPASSAADGNDQDERFARAAAGRRDDPENRGDVTSKTEAPGDGATPARARESGAATDAQRATATTGPGQAPGQGTGAGIGATPGGRVLGPRGAPAVRDGHDAPETLADADPDAPARASIIGTAAARGFAGAAYRPVYSEYRAAVEESLDSAAVPPGRRALVRRYFQLIRPRSPTP